MLDCWNTEPKDRPDFGDLVCKLGDQLEASVRQVCIILIGSVAFLTALVIGLLCGLFIWVTNYKHSLDHANLIPWHHY